MPKISLVIPTYTISKHLEKEALFAIASYKEQVDELIVTEDAGMFSPAIMTLVDRYIYNSTNQGFTKNVNTGWKAATSDFVMIVNSDTTLHKGNLEDLCIPGHVTSPVIVNQYIDRLAGPFWCTPKEVTEALGMLLEPMRTYSSDSEYDERVKDIFVKVPSVEIYHDMAQTVTAAGVEGGEEQDRDRKIYQELKEKGLAA
jgi:glycosyltransferase involved in cell wall biosynthesis